MVRGGSTDPSLSPSREPDLGRSEGEGEKQVNSGPPYIHPTKPVFQWAKHRGPRARLVALNGRARLLSSLMSARDRLCAAKASVGSLVLLCMIFEGLLVYTILFVRAGQPANVDNRNGTLATRSVDSSVDLCQSFLFTLSKVGFPTRTKPWPLPSVPTLSYSYIRGVSRYGPVGR